MTLQIDSLDQQLFLILNGIHTTYFDWVMWNVSSRLSWLIIMLTFLWTLHDKGWHRAVVAVLAIALTVAIADQVSAGVIKGFFERLRPTHEPSLSGMVHTVNSYVGGNYGFVSSHAANSFGVAIIASLIMKNRTVFWAMTAWAILQSFSRIYLGVHYPGDALGGLVLGLVAALAVYGLVKLANHYWPKAVPLEKFTSDDGRLMVCSLVVTVVIIAAISPFWLLKL